MMYSIWIYKDGKWSGAGMRRFGFMAVMAAKKIAKSGCVDSIEVDNHLGRTVWGWNKAMQS
jgi:hypothetical protein